MEQYNGEYLIKLWTCEKIENLEINKILGFWKNLKQWKYFILFIFFIFIVFVIIIHIFVIIYYSFITVHIIIIIIIYFLFYFIFLLLLLLDMFYIIFHDLHPFSFGLKDFYFMWKKKLICIFKVTLKLIVLFVCNWRSNIYTHETWWNFDGKCLVKLWTALRQHVWVGVCVCVCVF